MQSKHQHSRSKTFQRWFTPVPKIDNKEQGRENYFGLSQRARSENHEHDHHPITKSILAAFLLLLLAFSSSQLTYASSCTPTKRNSGAGARASSGPSATVPVNVYAAGDLVVFSAWCTPNCTFSGITLGSQKASQTSVVGNAGTTEGQPAIFYILSAASAGSQTATLTVSGSVTGEQIGYMDFSVPAGCSVSKGIDSALGTGSGTDVDTPSITPYAGGRLLYTFGVPTGSITSVNGPWTQGTIYPSTANADGYILSSATGTTTTQMTQTVNGAWQALSSAFVLTASSTSATLSLSPSSVAFGNVTVGSSSTLPIVATNTGSASVTISKATASGTGFSVSGPSMPLTLAAGQTASFSVSFDPTSTGSVTGSVAVASNATNSPNASLSGTGVNQHSVSLSWNASTSSNVTGYYIFRAAVSGGPYTQINSSPVSGTTYTDASVQAGDTYYYVATAVNSAGTQSSYSNQASASVPTP